MNLYQLFRPALFSLPAETAHEWSLKLLNVADRIYLNRLLPTTKIAQPVSVMGLDFINPLGLAAGLDKNGDCIAALSHLGFGFIEVGTVTPRPQPGNPKPRLFRLPQHQALINRMGFNNKGIDYLLKQIKQSGYQGILGINIGKNFDTPLAKASDDYLIGLRKSYLSASYVTINVSSPNTQNLRALQHGDEIRHLLETLKNEQQSLSAQHGKYTPLVIKIAPDLSETDLRNIARLLLEFGIDGVIATNTTIDREAVKNHVLAKETGGLSGAPLRTAATFAVKILADELNGQVPIIAAGGILSAADAQEKLAAGASLLQIYSGLIYKGPQLIKTILRSI